MLKIMALVIHIALQVVLIPLFLFWMESVFGPVPATLLILGYILTMPRTLRTLHTGTGKADSEVVP